MAQLIISESLEDEEFVNIIKHLDLTKLEQQLVVRLENAHSNIVFLEEKIDHITSKE